MALFIYNLLLLMGFRSFFVTLGIAPMRSFLLAFRISHVFDFLINHKKLFILFHILVFLTSIFRFLLCPSNFKFAFACLLYRIILFIQTTLEFYFFRLMFFKTIFYCSKYQAISFFYLIERTIYYKEQKNMQKICIIFFSIYVYKTNQFLMIKIIQ